MIDRTEILAFYARVGARVREAMPELETPVYEGELRVDTATEELPMSLGLANDGRGAYKLFAAAFVPKAESRAVGSRLGRLLGMVQVIPAGTDSEVRRWSPYRAEDIGRTPIEAEDWAVSTLLALLEELGPFRKRLNGARGTKTDAPPAPRPVEPEEVSGAAAVAGRAAAEAAGPAAALIPGNQEQVGAARRDAETALALAAEADAGFAAARAQLATMSEALTAVTSERDAAVARVRQLEDNDGSTATDPAVTQRLVAAFNVVADSGARSGTCVSVLRNFVAIRPGDVQLQELLGVHLLADGQLDEAIETLAALGADGLTPRGAAALVEAGFRQRRLPEPLEVLARVDWLVGSVAQQLREVPKWQRGDALLQVAELVGQSSPPDFGSFLAEVARVASRDQLPRVFRVWFDSDPDGALKQLVGWAEDERASMAEAWVAEALPLALDADDRRTARVALELLAADAERSRDSNGLADIVERGRTMLRPADWRSLAIRWIADGTAIAANDQSAIDRWARLLIEVLRDAASLQSNEPEHELAVVLERRASDQVGDALRAELARLRPAPEVTTRDITTVAEALQATKERFSALEVLPEADRSAARRGTVAVKKAREALFALGDIAQQFAAGDLEQGLDQALASLPDFKPDISDTAKRQYRRQYLRTLPGGRKILLGPHFDIGGDDGRAYLFVDQEARRIVLGHCGNHLPGKRDG